MPQIPTSSMLTRRERLEGYLTFEPDNLSLLVEVVQLQVEMGDALGARTRLVAALAKHPQALELKILDAMCHLAEHNYAQAAQAYELLIPLVTDSTKPVLVFNHAYAHFCLKDFVQAAVKWRELLRNAPTAPVQTATYLCRALHHQGLLDEAIRVFEESPIGQRTSDLFGVSSAVALDMDNAELANKLALQALQHDPQQIEALATIGSLGLLEGNPAQSMQMLSSALEQRPNDGRIWMSIAAGQLLQKDLPQAISSFRRAVELLPNHAGSLLGLAWCQIVAGDLISARQSVNRAMSLNRNFSEAHGAFAAIEALSGNRTRAEDAIRVARLLDPEDLSSHFAAAVLSGDGLNPSKMQRLAKRLLVSRTGLDIENIIAKSSP